MSDIGHSPYGASVSKRNCMCPGSFWLNANAHKSESAYANEGTLAHTLAEERIRAILAKREGDSRYWAEAIGHIPGSKRLVGDVEVEVTQDMLDAVQVYSDLIEGLIEEYALTRDDIRLEQKVSIPHPLTEDLWGRPDFEAVIPFYKLIVIDYKHGAGVDVAILNSFQLRYYALAAYLSLPLDQRDDLSLVELIIVQPRTARKEETGVKRWELSVSELLDFYTTLDNMINHVEIAKTDPYKYLNPGYEWCRFCDAKHDCPALRAKIQNDIGCELTDTSGIQPKTFSNTDLAAWLNVMPDIQSLLKAIKARAWAAAQHGEDIPGFELADSLGDREWVDADLAAKTFLPLLKDKMYKHVIMSPTQVEAELKALQKARPPNDLRVAAQAKAELEGLTVLCTRRLKGQNLVKSTGETTKTTKSKAQRDFDGIDLSGEL